MTPMRLEHIQRVKDALSKPYNGFGTDLAYKLGLSYQDFRIVLGTVRKRAWMEEEGWTIPFVGQGGSWNTTYAVVETKDEAMRYLYPGQKARGGDLLSILRNYENQDEIGIMLTDGRSQEGKWLRLASTQVKAMISMAEAMGL